MTRAVSKAAKRRARQRTKARRGLAAVGLAAGLADVSSPPRRQPNGKPYRAPEDKGADKVALKARCRQRGAEATSAQMRESRAPWWGCHAGAAMASAVPSDEDRRDLWDAIGHMRRVITAHDRAIGAPHRHAICLRLLLPPEDTSADATTAPLDTRTDAEKQAQAVAAYMQLEGWLSYTDKRAASEARRVVWDDAPARDPAALISALRCVSDGLKGKPMAWRGA